jgi:DNA-binding IclR family transcriptional regulator
MDPQRRWVDRLSEEDLAFLKRFLLASGTLKELAEQYGISYPTVRLRLDRLIQKVKLIDEQAAAGPFELTLRELYAEGRLDDRTFGDLLKAHQEEEHRETREDAR